MTRTVLTALLALGLSVSLAAAHGYELGPIKIGHPWARATPPGAQVGGGYLKLTNQGEAPDRLVGAKSNVAGRVEIHEMSVTDGVMKMRELPDGLAIAPGATVELKPGGFHLMLMELKQPLAAGSPVKATLTFEKAGSIEVELKVEPIGATPAPHDGAAAGHALGMHGQGH
jgi:copper(I)-binding protein